MPLKSIADESQPLCVAENECGVPGMLESGDEAAVQLPTKVVSMDRQDTSNVLSWEEHDSWGTGGKTSNDLSQPAERGSHESTGDAAQVLKEKVLKSCGSCMSLVSKYSTCDNLQRRDWRWGMHLTKDSRQRMGYYGNSCNRIRSQPRGCSTQTTARCMGSPAASSKRGSCRMVSKAFRTRR